MIRVMKKISKTAGLAPGALVHVGEWKTDPVRITVIDYDEKNCEEREVKDIEECYPLKDTPTVTWINIDGIHDVGLIEKIGAHFDFHSLVLEDILNTGQRPKYEDYEEHVFLVFKMIMCADGTKQIMQEQVSVLLGDHFVISFQERKGDVFDPIRERIRNAKGRIRKMGTDFLAYSLVDALVDSHYVILEKIGERIEEMEEGLVVNPRPETLQDIHNLKRDIIYLRKSVWPLREVVNSFARSESKVIKKTTRIFLRDLYDHTIQVIDTIETFRDMVTGMLDVYLSSISNRMNEVMKVLTIFAAIFIPLTFMVGVYGMNFDFMPELHWRWAYFALLGGMAIIGFGMLLYFKKRKWL